ncbi:MAG: ROK family protein [bacterium]
MKHDIFLSYSSKDEDLALRIEERLSLHGYRVWRDDKKIPVGGSLIKKVFEAIDNSYYFAIILTNNAIKSRWVEKELNAAIMREIKGKKDVILPLLREDCEVPRGIGDKRFADFRKNFDDGMNELINWLNKYNRRDKSNNRSTRSRNSKAGLSHVRNIKKVSNHKLAKYRSFSFSRYTLDQEKKRFLNAIRNEKDLFLVMDLGGTKAYLSLVDREAKRLFDRKFHTVNHNKPRKLLKFIKECIKQTIVGIAQRCEVEEVEISRKIKALGIAFPGPTDFENGVVLDASNFKIKDFPLVRELRKAFKFPVFVDNDVNLGVLGEHWKGVAKGYKNVVGIIIGTGIGGGILIDGKIYRGRNKTAGEIGHMIVDFNNKTKCGCGQMGCFEALASRKAMGKEVIKIKKSKGENLDYWKEKNIGSNEIADKFKTRDPDTIKAVKEAARVCGKAVFTILNLLNPDIIFFGGGFMRQIGDDFLIPVKKEAQKCMNAVYSVGKKNIPIVRGELDNPNLVGACKLILDNISGNKKNIPPGANANIKDIGRIEKSLSSFITKRLNKSLKKRLAIFYQMKGPILISTNSKSDFYEDKLRALRNLGLIETIGNQPFRKSTHVRITPLGKIVAGGILGLQR